MRLLQWESWCAILAFALTAFFILSPGPYPMAIFTFIAQPLFAIAGLGYIVKVIQDVRRHTFPAVEERSPSVQAATASAQQTRS